MNQHGRRAPANGGDEHTADTDSPGFAQCAAWLTGRRQLTTCKHPVPQLQYPIHEGSQIQIMGNDHQARAQVRVEFQHEIEDARTGGPVQVAGGFVGQDHRGPGHERPGNSRALAFAAG